MGRQRQSDLVDRQGGLASAIEVIEPGADGEQFVVCGIDITKYQLTKMEMEFIVEYMNNNMNAIDAALKVYGCKTRSAARQRAAYTLNSGRVYPVLRELIGHSVSKSLQFSPALLMSNIETWLQYDIRNYYDEGGTAIPLDEIPEDARQLISGVDYTVNGRTGERYVTYRLPDKYKALQELSSIVKFLQSIDAGSAANEDKDARSKRDEIFGKVSNYEPTEVEAEVVEE